MNFVYQNQVIYPLRFMYIEVDELQERLLMGAVFY